MFNINPLGTTLGMSVMFTVSESDRPQCVVPVPCLLIQRLILQYDSLSQEPAGFGVSAWSQGSSPSKSLWHSGVHIKWWHGEHKPTPARIHFCEGQNISSRVSVLLDVPIQFQTQVGTLCLLLQCTHSTIRRQAPTQPSPPLPAAEQWPNASAFSVCIFACVLNLLIMHSLFTEYPQVKNIIIVISKHKCVSVV